jgi:hypothetical protein
MECPGWLWGLATTDRASELPHSKKSLVEEDAHIFERVRRWLDEDAPEAVEEAGGDVATFQVACYCRELGATEATTNELMLDWNEKKACPPWPLEDLATKVRNAFAYGKGAPGSLDPRAEFGPFDISGTSNIDTEPVDLWADDSFPPDLAAGILPQALDRWVGDEATRKGVARGTVAVPAMVTCAAALPAQFVTQVKQNDTGHTDHAVLWGAIVGPPGARKSPVLNEMLAPLKALEKQWANEDQPLWTEYDAKLAAWKQKKIGPEPKRPSARRKIVMDTTTEAVATLEADNPAGLICFQDELAAWAGSMDAYRSSKSQSKDAPFWLSAKNGGYNRVDRSTREPLSIECHAVHVLGGIQPDVLSKFAPDWGGNGLLQRFLLANMQPSGPAPDLPVDAEARDAVHEALQRIARLKWSDEFSEPFKFSAAADKVRQEVVAFASQELTAFGTPAPLRGWLDKLEGEWARLATVFHVVKWATGLGATEIENAPRQIIDVDSAERAARFLIEFQFPHQRYFYQVAADLGAATDENARNIAGHILAHGLAEIRERDIYRSFPSLRKPQHRDARISAMRTLELTGWVQPIGNHRDGHNNKWRVADAAHDGRFDQRAEIERKRRESVRQKIAEAGALRREAA